MYACQMRISVPTGLDQSEQQGFRTTRQRCPDAISKADCWLFNESIGSNCFYLFIIGSGNDLPTATDCLYDPFSSHHSSLGATCSPTNGSARKPRSPRFREDNQGR